MLVPSEPLAVTSTHLDGSILAGRHHHAEGRVEDDTGDRTAMSHQGVLFWGAWDPLPGTATFTVWPACVELSLRLGEFRLQVHDLQTKCCHGNCQQRGIIANYSLAVVKM